MRIEPFLVYRKDEGGIITLSSLSNTPKLSYKELYEPQKGFHYENEKDLLIKTVVEELQYNNETMYRIVFYYHCVYKNMIVNCGRNTREWIEGCLIDSNMEVEDSGLEKIRVILRDHLKNKIGNKINLYDSMPLDYRYLYSNYQSGENDDIKLESIIITSLDDEVGVGIITPVECEQKESDIQQTLINKVDVEKMVTFLFNKLLTEKEILSKAQIDIEIISVLKKELEILIPKCLTEAEIKAFMDEYIKKQTLTTSQIFISLKSARKHTAINTMISVIISIVIILLIFLK